MDLTSAVKSEVIRPLLTLVGPGGTALAPYLLVAKANLPDLAGYLETHRTAAFILGLLAVLTAGLLLDTLGTWYEAHILDPRIAKAYPEFNRDWYNYLRLSWEHEPVGQRYLRTVTLHLKFELTMAPALLIAVPGLHWFRSVDPFTGTPMLWVATALLVLGAIYLLWEAWNSARVLARVRYALVYPQKDVGKDLSDIS